MKSLQNKVIEFKGKPLLDETAVELTVKTVLKAVLENSAYTNSSEIIKAGRILVKVEADPEISLAEDDYEFVKKWASVYPPLVNKGLMFLDFFNQLT